MELEIHNNCFTLLEEKALFWKEADALLIADLHLGKANHFRKSGIPVPSKPNDKNIDRLINLLQHVKPKRVIFMGDLFHSHYNPEWEVFGQVLKYFPAISFELVIGNHDILGKRQYDKHGLLVHPESIEEHGIRLSHEPLEERLEDQYNIAGHIHPGVLLRGRGRQALRLPCFYFGKKQALLPAFGELTGTYKITPRKGDRVVVVVDGKLMEV
ncbi:MAG: ligase-associated DNA damage response endonuclease PdeM [Bacteroidota bacterium]